MAAHQIHSVLCVILVTPRKGAKLANGGKSHASGHSEKPGMSGPPMMKPMPGVLDPGVVEAEVAGDGVDGDCMLPFCRPPQRQRGT
jgi:hypothetical protein